MLFLKFVTARFYPSNWLVSADEPSVVFIAYGEIAAARLVRERVQTPELAHPGATQTQFLKYVELELTGDIESLANALQQERSVRHLMKKHWYGSGSTLYRDYPLTMSTPPFLRIRWDVVPRAARFLAYLRQYTTIADAVFLKQDGCHDFLVEPGTLRELVLGLKFWNSGIRSPMAGRTRQRF
jgi:hypothetical protein